MDIDLLVDARTSFSTGIAATVRDDNISVLWMSLRTGIVVEWRRSRKVFGKVAVVSVSMN